MDSRAHRHAEPTAPTPSDAPTPEPSIDQAPAPSPDTPTAEPAPAIDKPDRPEIPPSDTPDPQPPLDRRERMAAHPLFNRDGWSQDGQAVDSPREQHHTAEDNNAEDNTADDTPTPHLAEPEPTTPAPQKPVDADAPHMPDHSDAADQPEPTDDADQPEPAEPSEPPPAAEEPATDPNDSKQSTASPEPPPTPESTDSAEESDPDTSSTPEAIASPSDAATEPNSATDDVQVAPEPTDPRISRWDPAKLNLPRPPAADSSTPGPDTEPDQADQQTVDEKNAVAYIAANKDERPWLAPAADCEPAVQSIYASLDQGTGHAHIRHGPMGDDQMYAARAARLEDPAQLDAQQRARGVDGFNSANLHNCAEFATRVHDARAFATLVAALCEEPRVQQAVHTDWNDVPPGPVPIMIADVLGPNGHEYCSGFRLKGEWPQSRVERRQWVEAHAAGQDLSDLPEPQAERIPTFEGGRFVVMFKRNYSTNKYEINTIITEPVKE